LSTLPELAEVYDEGFIKSPRRNPYYMGLYPCHQLTADADSGQVTDVSGRGAHASLGVLTAAEAWANAGYVSSQAVMDKSARIPLANWPFRFTYSSLILFAYQYLVKDGVNTLRILGNASSTTTATGFNVCCNTLGGLIINIINPASGSLFSQSTIGTIPYDVVGLHSWMIAYRKSTNGFFIYVDGVPIITEDGTIPRASVQAADTFISSGPAFGGRPGGSATVITACRTKWVHALSIEGPKDLPSNLNVIAKRLHQFPHLELPENALIF
jgi:hypothetical protein